MQLLFSAGETIATLVKYKCKTFITLTPASIEYKTIQYRDSFKKELKTHLFKLAYDV